MNNYLQAARVLDGVLSRKGSIKTLALRKEIANKRFVTALVSETLRHKQALDAILSRSNLRATLGKAVSNPHLLYLLLYDLLYGKGIQGGGQVKRLLLQHEPALREAAKGVEAPPPQTPSSAAAAKEDGDDGAASGAGFPRYARVNPLKTTVARAVAALTEGDGAVLASREDVQEDPHVPGLLVLPPGTDLHTHPLVRRGALVLQDKASCLSAQALLGDAVDEAVAGAKAGQQGGQGRPPLVPGDVIDACAAPGNKTSHAAALLHGIALANAASKSAQAKAKAKPKGKAKVFALDRDGQRLAILKRRVGDTDPGGMGYGPQLVVPLLQDFLQLDPADPRMAKVRAILLDPSCSGSGMVASLERRFDSHHHHHQTHRKKGKEENEDLDGSDEAGPGKKPVWRASVKHGGPTERLRALAQFQFKALTKAFAFPQVERVVYSTCSLHAEEDEMVAAAALRSEAEKAEAADPSKGGYRPFELRPALPSWPRRGLTTTPDGRPTGLDEAQAACVVRTDPGEDRTNGFFVARFERRGGGGVWLSGGPGGGSGGMKEEGKGKGKAKEKGKAKQEEKAAVKRPREESEDEGGDEDEDEDEGDDEDEDEGDDEDEDEDEDGGNEPSQQQPQQPQQQQQQAGGPTRAQRRRQRRKRVKQQLAAA